jgi:AcrR family transcriptional regulator
MKNSNNNSTRKKIINATLKLFVKNGYHGTSISQISSATKLTKGAIYFHFRSKDMLLKTILEEYERNFLNKMIEEVRGVKGTGMEKITHFFKFATNFAAENRELCLCLAAFSPELSSGKKKYQDLKKYYTKYRKLLADMLKEGIEDGSLREDIDPNILALNLIGANEGNLLQWSMNRNNCNGKEFTRSFMKFFLNGICKHK